MVKNFFVDSECGGFELFATESEALAYAKSLIPDYLDCDEWMVEVELIRVGQITHKATKTNLEMRPPESELDEDGCDDSGEWWGGDMQYKCDYEILPVTKESE